MAFRFIEVGRIVHKTHQHLTVVGSATKREYFFGWIYPERFYDHEQVNILFDEQERDYFPAKRYNIKYPHVNQALWSTEPEIRTRVLRYEIDYELAVLNEALKQQDHNQIIRSKLRLESLRRRALQLELL